MSDVGIPKSPDRSPRGPRRCPSGPSDGKNENLRPHLLFSIVDKTRGFYIIFDEVASPEYAKCDRTNEKSEVG